MAHRVSPAGFITQLACCWKIWLTCKKEKSQKSLSSCLPPPQKAFGSVWVHPLYLGWKGGNGSFVGTYLNKIIGASWCLFNVHFCEDQLDGGSFGLVYEVGTEGIVRVRGRVTWRGHLAHETGESRRAAWRSKQEVQVKATASWHCCWLCECKLCKEHCLVEKWRTIGWFAVWTVWSENLCDQQQQSLGTFQKEECNVRLEKFPHLTQHQHSVFIDLYPTTNKGSSTWDHSLPEGSLLGWNWKSQVLSQLKFADDERNL